VALELDLTDTGRFADSPDRGTRLGLVRKAISSDSLVSNRATGIFPAKEMPGYNIYIGGYFVPVIKPFSNDGLNPASVNIRSTSVFVYDFPR
jgi:hypothetical protein